MRAASAPWAPNFGMGGLASARDAPPAVFLTQPVAACSLRALTVCLSGSRHEGTFPSGSNPPQHPRRDVAGPIARPLEGPRANKGEWAVGWSCSVPTSEDTPIPYVGPPYVRRVTRVTKETTITVEEPLRPPAPMPRTEVVDRAPSGGERAPVSARQHKKQFGPQWVKSQVFAAKTYWALRLGELPGWLEQRWPDLIRKHGLDDLRVAMDRVAEELAATGREGASVGAKYKVFRRIIRAWGGGGQSEDGTD